MKKFLISAIMTTTIAGMCGCGDSQPQNAQDDKDFEWVVDRFDDIKVLRYKVPGFEQLPLQEKILLYYLNEAALCGRDIFFDQHFKYNLAIRRTLEAAYLDYEGDRTSDEWLALEKYLKKVWFASGIHHHYAKDKFTPEFSREYFEGVVRSLPAASLPQELGGVDELLAVISPAMFDPTLYPTGVSKESGVDLVVNSANNFYEGVTEAEVEKFYGAMANPADTTPISYGLNSKVVKENGRVAERTWRAGGMYSAAIEKIIYWLGKAESVAASPQKETIAALIKYYRSGDLKDFDDYSILWVQDTLSHADFVNGFIENYDDPLSRKATWESTVNFRNEEATRRTEIISEAAQWFEDHSPVDPRYRKEKVKGVSAKVITVTMLGGDCYPATPIGINLPNADWIRKDYGSKSVTIDNITHAYDEAAKGNGFKEEFMLRAEDRERVERYGSLGDDLHTDLHECLGHGSGQLAPGVKGTELKNYSSTLEEARADLFALYYLADPKLVELGLVPSDEVAKAQYTEYIMNGLMTQLCRIAPGKNIEEDHMRNRKLIAEWCYEAGRDGNVIEKIVENGKTYVVVNDFAALRDLFGKLLREIQRIKSEGDFEAGKALVERYGVKVDTELHREVLERYARLNLAPYSGFVNPVYTPVIKNGEIVDITIDYTEGYVEQMLRYSRDYSPLPTLN